MGCFLGALAGVVMATLVRNRALPFLRGDTILAAGGKVVPTEQWATFASKFLYVGSAAMVLLGLIALFTFSEANRRYIAQLPRWRRFLWWPGRLH